MPVIQTQSVQNQNVVVCTLVIVLCYVLFLLLDKLRSFYIDDVSLSTPVSTNFSTIVSINTTNKNNTKSKIWNEKNDTFDNNIETSSDIMMNTSRYAFDIDQHMQMTDILFNAGIDRNITLPKDCYSSCSNGSSSPIWSDPTQINQSFVFLWHSRVPKTASSSTKERFRSFENISHAFFDNITYTGKINTWLHWSGIYPGKTYRGADHYQLFAGEPPSLRMIDYKQWIQELLDLYWDMLYDKHYNNKNNNNKNNNISKMIQNININNINVVFNGQAHMLLIDDFVHLNLRWKKFIQMKSKHKQYNLNQNSTEYAFLSQLTPFLKPNRSCTSSDCNYNYLRLKWMIFLRDPIAHQISRFDWFHNFNKSQDKKYSSIINLTFDQCVRLLNYPKYEIMFNLKNGEQNKNANYINPCFLSINYFTRWLCGISNVCQYNILNSTNAVIKAIDNINKIFDFVGIVEYYDESWNYLIKKFSLTFYPNIIKPKLYLSNTKENEAGTQYNKLKYNKTIPLESSVIKLRQFGYLDQILYKYVKTRFETCILPNI